MATAEKEINEIETSYYPSLRKIKEAYDGAVSIIGIVTPDEAVLVRVLLQHVIGTIPLPEDGSSKDMITETGKEVYVWSQAAGLYRMPGEGDTALWGPDEVRPNSLTTFMDSAPLDPNSPSFLWLLRRHLLNTEDRGPSASDIVSANPHSGHDPSQTYILLDAHLLFNQPPFIRGLRDFYMARKYSKALRRRQVILTLSHPQTLPLELQTIVHMLELPYPEASDLKHIFLNLMVEKRRVFNATGKSCDGFDYTIEEATDIAAAAVGLSYNEFVDTARELTNVHLGTKITPQQVTQRRKAKMENDPVLELVDPDISLDQVGGLDNAKTEIRRLTTLMDPKAAEFEVEVPNSFMILGLPGCQPAGSKVLRANGAWANAEDIKQGDKLISPQRFGDASTIETVEATMIYEDVPCFRIQAIENSNISYEASHDHILPILRLPDETQGKEKGFQLWEPTVGAFNDAQKKLSTYRSKACLFTTPAFELSKAHCLPMDPYAAAVLISDGTLKVPIDRSAVDPTILEALEKTEEHHRYNAGTTKGKGPKFPLLAAKVFGKTLGKCKRVPSAYKHSSISQRLELLAGFIDASNYRSARTPFNNLSPNLITTSRQIADDFGWLVHSVGGVAQHRERGKKYTVTFTFSKERPTPASHLIVPSSKTCGYYPLKVTPTKRKTVYGFTLSGTSQWYVTDNWIVTHNSGKSIMIRAIAAHLGWPLLRLSLGTVLSSTVGSSEARFRGVLKRVDALNRCVVWIDEIEKMLGGAGEGSNRSDGGVTTRIFGDLLYWMERRSSQAIIAVTANQVFELKPELKRRFRSIWFVDTPTPAEKAVILHIHLKKRGRNLSDEDIREVVPHLQRVVAGVEYDFTGAEIERVVQVAIASKALDNMEAKRTEWEDITANDLIQATREVVPQTFTEEKEIKLVREMGARYSHASADRGSTFPLPDENIIANDDIVGDDL